MSTTNEVKASYFILDEETQDSVHLAQAVDESCLFTHIFLAFAKINPRDNLVIISEKHKNIASTYTQNIKKGNPQVKFLLSIGGKKANRSAFASMASHYESRKCFIDSMIYNARSNNFDGLDLAWEYPDGKVEMDNFELLLKEWRLAIEKEVEDTEKIPLLLTAAVYYSSEYNFVSYPVDTMTQSLDWVNIIAFDFYGSSTIIGPPGALYVPSNQKAPCGHNGLKQWMEAGLPEKKAVFGFPCIGWQWKLPSGYNLTAMAHTTQLASSVNGSITYDEIKSLLNSHQATPVYDPMVVGDFCTITETNTLVGYDDVSSVVTKVRFAKQSGLLGYFSSNIEADVIDGLCRAASDAWDY